MKNRALFSLILIFLLSSCTRLDLPPPSTTQTDFVCPITVANGSQPPGESVSSPDYHGNGELWVALWPDGKTIIPPERVEQDGRLSMKFPWWRGVSGRLEITGRRLDAEALPPEAEIPEGYGETGFQATAITFPTEGCWEITGKAGQASLTIVTMIVKG